MTKRELEDKARALSVACNHTWALEHFKGGIEFKFCINQSCPEHYAAERQRLSLQYGFSTKASSLVDSMRLDRVLGAQSQASQVQGDIGAMLHFCHYRQDPKRDGLSCGCGAFISGENLAALGYSNRPKYDRNGNDLADKCQRLYDENVKILAENARLRRGNR